jgi:quinolinate synthase
MGDVCADIDAIRREWGSRLLILGHYYQEDGVLRHADVLGDSLELSRQAAASTAERIVFCGVHFMAESADILTAPHQAVYMPETGAGCPMADMADITQVERAWAGLRRQEDNWLPVVYVNSSARVKAFCGRAGGSACTSSNAPRIVKWVLAQGKRPFFLPDRHLGENTAHDLGLAEGDVAVYDYRQPDGGLTPDALRACRMLVWGGFCPIHVAFTTDQIRRIRETDPTAKIIVHPEAPREVVRLADAHGSTSQIMQYVEAAPSGAHIFIGTEIHLVRRLAARHHGRVTVEPLKSSLCPNMAKTNEQNLLTLLREWPDRSRVRVPSALAAEARLCLERMLKL